MAKSKISGNNKFVFIGTIGYGAEPLSVKKLSETSKLFLKDLKISNTTQIESISTTATQTAEKFNWLVKNITFNEISSKDYILSQLLDSGAKESWVNDIWSSFTRISALPFSEVGFGIMTIENKKEYHFDIVSATIYIKYLIIKVIN